MSDLIIVLLLTTLVLALKAIEYRGDPRGIYAVCSIGAWVAYAVTIVVLLLT